MLSNKLSYSHWFIKKFIGNPAIFTFPFRPQPAVMP